MKTIAICNNKGGVAKTTTAVNLAAILARDFGRRVLVIDADSQGNATSFLGGDKSRPGMAALLQGAPMVPLQLTNTGTDMQLIAASDELMDLDLTKAGEGKLALGCLRDLRQYLETQPLPFDYCLVDCPPAFNAASSAALIAADAVLIPVKLDAFALEGMANLTRQIANMRKINPRLRVLGVLPVMWYRSETIIKAESALRNAGLRVLPRIRRSDRVDDMTYHQQPLIVCSPRSGPCRDYRALASWIVGQERRDAEQRTGGSFGQSPQDDRDTEPLRGHDVEPGKRRPGRTRKGGAQA